MSIITTSYGKRALRIQLIILLFSFLVAFGAYTFSFHGWPAFASLESFAGEESDGSESDLLDLPQVPTDRNLDYGTIDKTENGFTYSEVMMKPDEMYDISKNKHATWMSVATSGTYYLKGTSKNTLLMIYAAAGDDINVVFCDDTEGIRMVATQDCPGAPAKARSAITITGGEGGKVTLTSAAGQNCYFRAKGGVPAIRKDSTAIETVFATADTNNPGTFEVHADPDATKTSAIGCFSNGSKTNTFGNVTFKSGKIRAYGSENGVLGGGPGIGADMCGDVDGITFENADVQAYAGSGSSAAIGTASCFLLLPFTPNPEGASNPAVGDDPGETGLGDRRMGTICKNITIKGGSVSALHNKHVNTDLQSGGAGIGGGWGCHSDSIIITGGSVIADGAPYAAGIGGGEEGNCNGYSDDYAPHGYDSSSHGVVIRGGSVNATGGATGIGSGYANAESDEKARFSFGDCRVEISGGEVIAIGTDIGKNGFGIGGFKAEENDPVMKVIISGGKVSTSGSGCGIGTGNNGVMQSINISGGLVTAISTTAENPSIGGPGSSRFTFPLSYCNAVNITGGTIITKNSEKDDIGWIGGYKNSDKSTPVYISGGNVFCEIYKGEAKRSSSDSTIVYPNKLSIQSYGLNTDLRSKDNILIKGLTLNGGNTEYGLNDAFLRASKLDSDTIMSIWLPEGVSVSSAETDPAFLEYGLNKTEAEVTSFHGLTSPKEGGVLYPGFYFLFDENYSTKNTSTCSAFINIGDAKNEHSKGKKY